jgi:predicted nucleic-acid-binding Zn-ribbon protein
MTRIPNIENESKLELILTGKSTAKIIHMENGLFQKQRLSCANHSDEEIVLDQIGWKNFICPKCGRDYSIGRKIIISEQT